MSAELKNLKDKISLLGHDKLLKAWKLTGEQNAFSVEDVEFFFTPCPPVEANLKEILSNLSSFRYFSYLVNDNSEKSQYTYVATFSLGKQRQHLDHTKAIGMIRF